MQRTVDTLTDYIKFNFLMMAIMFEMIWILQSKGWLELTRLFALFN